jgi:hypothetical protein
MIPCIGPKGFVVCAAYGGHIWKDVKIHDARSFGHVTDERVCTFCGRKQIRQRFLGAAIRTEGTWEDVPPSKCRGAECYGCPVACPEKGYDIPRGRVIPTWHRPSG